MRQTSTKVIPKPRSSSPINTGLTLYSCPIIQGDFFNRFIGAQNFALSFSHWSCTTYSNWT